MIKIQGQIPRRSYEIIRDRICQILVEEFEAQLIYSGDYDLDVQIFMERMVAFDHTELPALNVGIERGDAESYHQGQSDWALRFFIESNTRAETGERDDVNRGDQIAKMKVQKIMGIAQAILENPAYKTLGFTPGQLIKHRHIESFVFAENTRHDSENTTMSRMILVVKTVETTELIESNLIVGWDTQVKLHDSDRGYFWSKDSQTDDLTTDEDDGLDTDNDNGVISD